MTRVQLYIVLMTADATSGAVDFTSTTCEAASGGPMLAQKARTREVCEAALGEATLAAKARTREVCEAALGEATLAPRRTTSISVEPGHVTHLCGNGCQHDATDLREAASLRYL
jgi:hypothetical protein